jgi:hypothetical protein
VEQVSLGQAKGKIEPDLFSLREQLFFNDNTNVKAVSLAFKSNNRLFIALNIHITELKSFMAKGFRINIQSCPTVFFYHF